MPKFQIASVLAALCLAAGCAAPVGAPSTMAPAPAVPVDVGPAAPTAVLSTSYTLDGRILPVVRGTDLVETRADMRRTDSAVTFDNWLLRQVAGDGRSSDIVRLDSHLLWTLYHAKKTYKECPLTGCIQPARATDDKPQKKEPAKEDTAQPSCPLSVRRNDLKVTGTGEHRQINGWDTQHYQMNWIVELEDPQKRRTANTVVLDLWTTPETGSIQDVERMNEVFTRRWLTELNATEHPMNRYLPRNVLGALEPLVRNSLGKSGGNTSILGRWGNEFKKIQGYPILTTVTWNVEGNACSDSSQSPADSAVATPPTSVSGLVGNLLGNAAQDKAKDMASTGALLTYSSEVKTMEVKPVSDSSFVPPSTYQKTQ
jgi:hypothetical protein